MYTYCCLFKTLYIQQYHCLPVRGGKRCPHGGLEQKCFVFVFFQKQAENCSWIGCAHLGGITGTSGATAVALHNVPAAAALQQPKGKIGKIWTTQRLRAMEARRRVCPLPLGVARHTSKRLVAVQQTTRDDNQTIATFIQALNASIFVTPSMLLVVLP